jgi:hypothetical protein
MRPDFVFSDSSLSPSFFLTTPAKKPRTECGCHPVTFEIAACCTALGLEQAQDAVVLGSPSA